MGIKEAFLNKILGKVAKGVNLDAITQNAKDGKYDINKMVATMEKLIGKEASNQLVSKIKEKAEKGEKVGISEIIKLVKEIDMSNIQRKAENGEISVEGLQSTLSSIVGEKETEQIFSTFTEEVKKAEEEENNK